MAQAYNTSVEKLMGPAALEENLGLDETFNYARTRCFGVD